MTAPADLTIRRGDNSPAATWRLQGDGGLLLPLDPSDTYLLTISWRGGSLSASTADALSVDAATSTITWAYSADDSLLLPLGKLSRYDLDRLSTDGHRTTVAAGMIKVLGLGDPGEVTSAVVLVQGPPGVGAILSRLAAGPLSGHRVVKDAGAGHAAYPDTSDPADARLVLGVTQAAAAAEAGVNIQRVGDMVEPSWSWTPGGAVFCGPGGALTQAPPTSGWLRQVGVAVSPTQIVLDLQPPIQIL